MVITIATASTPFAQVLKHLSLDTDFADLLTGGIFPDLSKPVPKQMPPIALAKFALVKQLTDEATSQGGNNRVTFLVELHDLPDTGRKAITAAAERAEWLFNGRLWEPCTASGRVPMRSWWMATVGPITDPFYKTSKLMGQFYITAH